MEEIWKPIDGYSNYCVSNKGRIKSLNYRHTGKEKIKKLTTNNKTGYLQVVLSKNSKLKTFLLHRIVAGTFPEICGELFKGCEVDHIDTNKENNNANNLRCVTQRENRNNPLTKKHNSEAQKGKIISEESRKRMSAAQKGRKHPETIKRKISEALSKPLLQIDKTTNEVIREWQSTQEVERKLGFNHSTISACCLGKRKSCGGFKWQYKT